MKTILITGPESSGKTYLADKLSKEFSVPVLYEYAREYLEENGENYAQATLLKIAKEHKIQYDKLGQSQALIMDTYLMNIKIWSLEKYGNCDPWILETLKTFRPQLVLLCKPDIPWEPDPLRENRDTREHLFNLYLKELHFYDLDHFIVDKDSRGNIVQERVKEFLSKV